MGRDVIPYTREGYIDMEALLAKERSPFIFMTGARGAGKTYGAVEYMLSTGKPWILMRRTQTQAQFAGSVDTSPINANLRNGEYIQSPRTGIKGLYKLEVCSAENEILSTCIVFGLSTVSSLRGIDLSACEWIVFDEFIKEPHDRPIKQEYDAFRNAIETIGRNRELQGRPPLRVLALSNALELANPYYKGLGIINQVYAMTGDCWRDPERGIVVYRPQSEMFAKKKKQTSLYQLGDAEKTLGNQWADMDLSHVRSISLKGAVPICSINGVGFYRTNSRVFASAVQPAGVPAYDLADVVQRRAVHVKQQGVINAIFNQRVTYESVAVMLAVRELTDEL